MQETDRVAVRERMTSTSVFIFLALVALMLAASLWVTSGALEPTSSSGIEPSVAQEAPANGRGDARAPVLFTATDGRPSAGADR